ncbi:sperm axonemal maintenance protein CFAP97D1-like isoform X1 [Scyliorhinus canicula]|uniref:sperm axonemal maintenance protein CFAP97D1-like isoform X1 n=1 Tax=Scyliorhinus canicula TaxID=7830 RepID=UPI0018F7924D|nr:sperm axonemal maintenance protein CFAP97D1-like isoform X1 [Scyliorhinus canicula]
MHRAYQPILPSGSKYLQEKWDRASFHEHRRKIKAAKTTIDNNSPETFPHLNLKFNKLKLEEDRLSTIERDNRLLLQKMSTIMRTTSRIDNKNEYKLRSLNSEKRQREQLRVNQENKTMQERLKLVQPQYDHLKWHQDWYKAEKLMDHIARYPRGWYNAQNSKPKGSKSSLVGGTKNSKSEAPLGKGEEVKYNEKRGAE